MEVAKRERRCLLIAVLRAILRVAFLAEVVLGMLERPVRSDFGMKKVKSRESA
jgi:hypothetical protein